ncbi:MAG: hypothetical protein ACKO6N_00695 [Myxococcota bacterium]
MPSLSPLSYLSLSGLGLKRPERPRTLKPVELEAQMLQKDRRVLEVRHLFPLPTGEEEVTYSYDLYLFFPRSFGVTPESWAREDFYRAATLQMRLNSPYLGLHELADLAHPMNPAGVLRKQIAELLEPDVPSPRSMAALAQMLGAELADKVSEQAARLRQEAGRLRSPQALEQFEARLHLFCDDILLALGTLKRLRAKALAYAPVAPPALLTALGFAEEFASAIVDERLAQLAVYLEQCPALHDGTGRALRLRLRLGHTVEMVNHRRLDQGYAIPDISEHDGEWFTYRKANLKRELQRILYVDTRSVSRDPFYRNSAAAVGAGLAATWATIAQFQLFQQGLANPNSLLLLGAAVGAYVLKDRIKEWSRNVLSGWLIRWDHDQELSSETLEQIGMGGFSGRARERMGFLGQTQLPPEIHAIRSACHTMKDLRLEEEQVVHYHRQLTLEPRSGMAVPEGFGIREFFRLSLDGLLKALDEPRDKMAFYDSLRGRFREVTLPRVYHINAVLRTTEAETGRQLLQGVRVVVDRKRIKRVETVVEQQEQLKTAGA